MDSEEMQRALNQQLNSNTAAAMGRAGVQAEEEEEEDDMPMGQSSNVNHPNYRPSDMEPVYGVTDRRWEGRLKLWFEDKGYGFIECEQMKKKFKDVDVFLHQNQKRHFSRGDYVSFSVFMNFRGKPQATELRRKKEPDAGEDG